MLINAYAINAIVINGGEESLLPHSGEPGSGRYVSDDELARLLEGNYGVWPRVKIADAAGVIQDYSVRGSRDWGMAISYEGNIDAPIATATVKLWREHSRRSAPSPHCVPTRRGTRTARRSTSGDTSRSKWPALHSARCLPSRTTASSFRAISTRWIGPKRP
jgi:hypothetical protein